MATPSLKYAPARFGLAALITLALYGAPAAAQEQTRTQSVEVYGGEMFGDNLTNAPVSGRTPHLNDNAVVGARYNYNFTDMWGIQLSGGYSPNRASRVVSGKDNLGLTTVDLDAVWNITSHHAYLDACSLIDTNEASAMESFMSAFMDNPRSTRLRTPRGTRPPVCGSIRDITATALPSPLARY